MFCIKILETKSYICNQYLLLTTYLLILLFVDFFIFPHTPPYLSLIFISRGLRQNLDRACIQQPCLHFVHTSPYSPFVSLQILDKENAKTCPNDSCVSAKDAMAQIYNTPWAFQIYQPITWVMQDENMFQSLLNLGKSKRSHNSPWKQKHATCKFNME